MENNDTIKELEQICCSHADFEKNKINASTFDDVYELSKNYSNIVARACIIRNNTNKVLNETNFITAKNNTTDSLIDKDKVQRIKYLALNSAANAIYLAAYCEKLIDMQNEKDFPSEKS